MTSKQEEHQIRSLAHVHHNHHHRQLLQQQNNQLYQHQSGLASPSTISKFDLPLSERWCG